MAFTIPSDRRYLNQPKQHARCNDCNQWHTRKHARAFSERCLECKTRRHNRARTMANMEKAKNAPRKLVKLKRDSYSSDRSIAKWHKFPPCEPTQCSCGTCRRVRLMKDMQPEISLIAHRIRSAIRKRSVNWRADLTRYPIILTSIFDHCRLGRRLATREFGWTECSGKVRCVCYSCARNRLFVDMNTPEPFLANQIRLIKSAKRRRVADWKPRLGVKDPDKCKITARAKCADQRRYRTNERVQFDRRIRSRLRNALRKGVMGTLPKHTEQWLGYTYEQLHDRLLATLPHDATWRDFMAGRLHIDHIRPLAAYPATEAGCQQANQLDNLQLLWASDNLSKSDKLVLNG